MREWRLVNICEESGNWNYFTFWYPDGLGIDRPNWISGGGRVSAPSSPKVQVFIAEKLIHRWGIGVPDQNGVCSAW